MNIVITFEGATIGEVTEEICIWALESAELPEPEAAALHHPITGPPEHSARAIVVPADVTPPVVVPVTVAPVVAAAEPAGTSYIAPDVTVIPADPVATPSVDVDAMPWDGRIHSETPVLKKDGRWRMKRGLAQKSGGLELIASVEAELRGGVPAQRSASEAVAAALPPAALPAPPPEPSAEGVDASKAIGLASAILAHAMGMADSKAAQRQAGEEITTVMTEHGVTGGVPDLLKHPEQVPSITVGLQAVAARWGVPSA